MHADEHVDFHQHSEFLHSAVPYKFRLLEYLTMNLLHRYSLQQLPVLSRLYVRKHTDDLLIVVLDKYHLKIQNSSVEFHQALR